MRIKFTDVVNGSEDFKEKFCDMIDKLPFDINEYKLSGINLYFNVSDKDTGGILELVHDGKSVNCLCYGVQKKKKEINTKQKIKKQGKIIRFQTDNDEQVVIKK